MMQTLAAYSAAMYRNFSDYTARRLEEIGLRFGSLFLVVYVGKHPGCTQSELTKALHLDWGYSQRSILRLVDEGFLFREKTDRAYHLRLTEKGEEAFSVSHQVFFDWDREFLKALSPEEQKQLAALLKKAVDSSSVMMDCKKEERL